MNTKRAIRDLHPFHERDLIRTGDNTLFSPLVSCGHKWMLGKKTSNWTKAMVKLGQKELEDVCSKCSATCLRNAKTGEMTEYHAPELAQIEDAA